MKTCDCRIGDDDEIIVCDLCAAAQIEATASTVVNPLLSEEEVTKLTTTVTNWLTSLIKA